MYMTQQRGILPSTGWAGTLSVVDGEPGWVLEGKGPNKFVQSPHYIPLVVPPRGPAKGERPLLTPIRGNANGMPRLLTHSEGPLVGKTLQKGHNRPIDLYGFHRAREATEN